jgi:hypothetical protein
MNKYYISLGDACSVAYQLQQNRLKKESLPFDWIRVNNFKDVINIFKDNFSNFCDIDSLQLIKKTNNFPIVNDIFPNENNNSETYVYHHKIYNIDFFHDFHTDIKNLDTVKNFVDKYNRRIIRLYDILKSNNEIIFIRDENKYSINNETINMFIQLMNEINPNMNYKLNIVIHNHKLKKLDIDDYIKDDKILIIIDNSTINRNNPRWIRSNFDWNKVF